MSEAPCPGALPRASWRLAVTVALALYGILCIRTPESFRLLDGVNLAIHETGHIVFAPFGELMMVLGGTIFQLVVPLLFVASFVKRGDLHSATVPLFWEAQSMWNVARYVADARALELPLVGGGEHDWLYLLDRWNVLEHDLEIASAIRAAGVMVFGVSVVVGLVFAMGTKKPRNEASTAAPVAR